MAIPEPTSNADEIANWKDEQEQYIQLLEEVLQKCARELAHDDQVPVSQYPTTVGPALQVCVREQASLGNVRRLRSCTKHARPSSRTYKQLKRGPPPPAHESCSIYL